MVFVQYLIDRPLVSGAHFSNHERKVIAAHFSLQERMMSAKVSKERRKQFKNKINTALIKTQNFPYINSIEASNYTSYQ